MLILSLKKAFGRIAFVITGVVTAAPSIYSIARKAVPMLPEIPTLTVSIVVFLICIVVFAIIRIYVLEKKIQPVLTLSVGPRPQNERQYASVRLSNDGADPAINTKVRLLKVMEMDGTIVHEFRDSLRRLGTANETSPIRSGEDKCFAVAKNHAEMEETIELQYWRESIEDNLLVEGEYLLEIQALSESTPQSTATFRLFTSLNGCNLELWPPEST